MTHASTHPDNGLDTGALSTLGEELLGYLFPAGLAGPGPCPVGPTGGKSIGLLPRLRENAAMSDEARQAVVAALIKLAASPDYHDRADAGRSLASFAEINPILRPALVVSEPGEPPLPLEHPAEPDR